ncbi:TPA: phage tail tape measure protein, partial [Providencia alcalifaciens]
MSKDLRLQVILSAVDKFTKPLRGVQTSNKKLAETLRRSRQELKELNLQAKQIEGFKRTKQSLDTANKAYQQASAKVTKLAQELSLAQNPTKSQIRAFEQAK